MISGHNIDIKHGGRVFHVQTEDFGRRNPVIETLVYVGGQILHRERVSYADQNDDATYSEEGVARLLEMQHRRIIDNIKAGHFDERRPFGEEFITNRTFDECVLAFLLEESQNQSMSLAVESLTEVVAGQPAEVTVRAVHRNSNQPIAGVVIRGRLIHSAGSPDPLPEAKTDAEGRVRIPFTVPAGDGNAALIVQGESEFGRDEVHRLLF